MSRENGARRNRAGRKLRKSKLPPEIKEAIQVVIDLLNYKSGYQVAWPSAQTIAARMGRKRRSGLLYVKVIKALGIFHVRSMSPQDAIAYCQREFGMRPKLERCAGQAPNLFIVNESHPLWNTQRNLPAQLDQSMCETARKIKAARNAKTTSKLASDKTRRPKNPSGSIADQLSEDLKCLLNSLSDKQPSVGIDHPENGRWCSDDRSNGVANDTLNDVASDTNHSVANDTQVFKHLSCKADESVTSQDSRFKKPTPELLVIKSPNSFCRQAKLSALVRFDAPPPAQPENQGSSQLKNHSIKNSTALAVSECRVAIPGLTGSGCAALFKPGSTNPYRNGISKQGMRNEDQELLATINHLEEKKRESENLLAEKYSDRPDAEVLDKLSHSAWRPSLD